jgi:hypothetical protein
MARRTRREFLRESTLGGGGAIHGLSRSSRRGQPGGSGRGVLAHWRFDGDLLDSASGHEDTVSGNHAFVEGIEGRALKLDGFTTRVTRSAADAPRLRVAFAIDAWIALAAYPWNWCSLICQRDRRLAGYDLAIGPQGELSFGVSMDDVHYRGEWRVSRSEVHIPLESWTHVAAIYDATGIRLYLNGREAGRLDVAGRPVFADGADLLIGQNPEKVAASHPHRSYSNLPTWFALDGLIDELQIHDAALSEDEIRRAHTARRSSARPALANRRLPSPASSPERFGASYCKLDFYEEWDALWPTGEHPDIVVRFDDSPVRVVFWRGTSYSPAWLTENDLWMTDQSVEGWNEEGTFEHMNDPRCLHSHVRVVENHDARVVVHWRYAPVNTAGHFYRFDEITGWGLFIDEYHTFYPDGVASRRITWPTGALGTPRQFQETLPLCHPGERAEDMIELEALTLGNAAGESVTYRWPGDAASRETTRPDDANVEIVHLRSRAQPFYAFEPGTRIQVLGGTPRRGIYSVFPHVNHWPVAMIPSDGRTCLVPDRASSFSPCIASPPVHEKDGHSHTAWLWGTCDGTLASVVSFARASSRPPDVRMRGNSLLAEDRAYSIDAPYPAEVELGASETSPLVRPAFVAKRWGSAAPRVALDDRELSPGSDYRFGYVRTLDDDDLVIWLDRTLSSKGLLRLG